LQDHGRPPIGSQATQGGVSFAQAADERNWMEVWWEQLAYLRTRTTMAVHINWFGVMPDVGLRLTNVSPPIVKTHRVP